MQSEKWHCKKSVNNYQVVVVGEPCKPPVMEAAQKSSFGNRFGACSKPRCFKGKQYALVVRWTTDADRCLTLRN